MLSFSKLCKHTSTWNRNLTRGEMSKVRWGDHNLLSVCLVYKHYQKHTDISGFPPSFLSEGTRSTTHTQHVWEVCTLLLLARKREAKLPTWHVAGILVSRLDSSSGRLESSSLSAVTSVPGGLAPLSSHCMSAGRMVQAHVR